MYYKFSNLIHECLLGLVLVSLLFLIDLFIYIFKKSDNNEDGWRFELSYNSYLFVHCDITLNAFLQFARINKL